MAKTHEDQSNTDHSNTDQSNLLIAQNTLLSPAGLQVLDVERVLDKVLGFSVDYADLYFQSSRSESYVMEDGIIKEGAYSIDYGVGVRALSGEKTGFAYSDDILLPALEEAATAARSIASQGGGHTLAIQKPNLPKPLYPANDPLTSISDQAKIDLIRKAEQTAKKLDPRIIQVMCSLNGTYEVILIAGSDGTYTADVRPLVRINVSVIAEHKGRRERGSSGGGGRYTYEQLIAEDMATFHAHEAVRQALVNLSAVPAPVGLLPVVLGAGWPGVLLHEAVGHGLEGDFNRKGSSAFANRIGEKVASSLCTVVDDGTLPNRRGSLTVDDEGTKTSCTTLIENGILKGYLQDKLNARLMKMPLTGNGRRESYSSIPMPRMTNTYMRAGNHTKEEIISSVEKGIYAVNFSGGQVDITSGKFVFNASEAYAITKGKITHPVKGVTLIGNGPDILMKVSMVGNDLELDRGIGVCGKEGQSVPVGVGQPTLKVDELTVGGTQL